MREIIDINELQSIELNILKEIDNYCLENKLQYFVTAGTMLGAVRHKGFIPWDDDIDISMPRSDYQKLICEFSSEHYSILTNENTEDYYYNFAKIVDKRTYAKENLHKNEIKELGVWVDIFPLDGLTSYKGGLHYKIVHFLNRMCLFAKSDDLTAYRGWLNKLLCNLSRWIGFKKIIKLYNIAVRKYDIKSVPYYFLPNSTYGKKVISSTKNLKDTLRVPFENIQVNIPDGYDNILKNVYGDYMTLPPVDKRIAHHNASFYWKNEK